MKSDDKVIIIGAGPAGLSVAYYLIKNTDLKPVIIEETPYIGGISRTHNHNGNRMDLGGHRFFSKSDEVLNFWKEIFPVQEMLKILHDKGYKIAVVSNKYDDAVKELCKNYFNGFIDFAIGEGYGIERKPNPNGVYKAIQVLNSTIENSLYIGDSEVDILTAKNASIPCISVLWGFREKEFLVNNGAKIFAQNAKELFEIIENFT